MSTLHKSAGDDENGNHEHEEALTPTQALAYEDDVTLAALEQLREKAAPSLKGKTWEVVDGYADKQPASVAG